MLLNGVPRVNVIHGPLKCACNYRGDVDSSVVCLSLGNVNLGEGGHVSSFPRRGPGTKPQGQVTKVKETVIRNFLFAYDCALNANTKQMIQHEMDFLSQGCDNFGLTISTKKTEVMYQPAPGKSYKEPHVTVNGQNLSGSSLSRVVYMLKSTVGLLRPASPSDDSVRMSGNREASASPVSRRFTVQWY